MASPATHPPPEVIGRAFVEQYYHVLHDWPENVYRFYMDSSFVSRPDANGEMTSVTTEDAINKLVLSLDSRNYVVQVDTVDAQTSYKDGVLILVTGCLKGTSDGIRQKFTQSFFLAPQNKEGSYFVLNDMFRFVDERQLKEGDQMFVDGTNADVVKAPVTPDQDSPVLQDRHVAEPATPTSDAELENGNKGSNSSENGGLVVEEEVVVDQQIQPSETDTPPVSEATVSVTQVVAKKSYASIVKVVKGSTPVGPVYVPTKAKAAIAKTEKAIVSPKPIVSSKLAPPPPETPPPETPAASNSNAIENNSDDVAGHSIYIKNLPLDATAAHVEEVFKKFGVIKPGGVQVRNHKIDNFCFGFVEFESLSSMQAAMEASPVIIGDRKVFVEEKKTTTRVINGIVKPGNGNNGNGRGRYPTARGGYRSENFRGRGGYANHQGYGRSDFRNRGEYSNRGDYANRGGEYTNRGRGQAGRTGEVYQQRVAQNSNGRISRPNAMNQTHVTA